MRMSKLVVAVMAVGKQHVALAMVRGKLIVRLVRGGAEVVHPVVVRVDIMSIAPTRIPRAVVAVVREAVFVVTVLAVAEFAVPPVPVVVR